MSAKSLDWALNGRVVPFLALHVGVFGIYVLWRVGTGMTPFMAYDYALELTYAYVLVGVALCGLIAFTLWHRAPDLRVAHNVAPAYAPTAAFLLLVVACWGGGILPTYGSTLVAIILLYGILAALVWTQRAGPYELIFSALYLSVFLSQSGWDDLTGATFATCFIAGTAILWRIGRIDCAFGLLIGMALFLKEIDVPYRMATWAVVAGLSIPALIAAVSFDRATARLRHSKFRHLLSQGVVAFVSYGVVYAVHQKLQLPDREGERLFADVGGYVWAVAFAIYSWAMSCLGSSESRIARWAWLGFCALALLWLTDWQEIFWNAFETPGFGRFWLYLMLSLLIAAVLTRLAEVKQDGFLQVVAWLVLIVTLWLFRKHALEFDNQIVSSGGGWPMLGAIGQWVWLAMAYCIGVFSVGHAYRPSLAWWRGLVRPRYLVITLRLLEGIHEWLKKLPVIGHPVFGSMSAAAMIRKWEGGKDMGLMSDGFITLITILIATTSYWVMLTSLAIWHPEPWEPAIRFGSPPSNQDISERVAFVSTWMMWGTAYYGYGIWRRRPFYYFVGSVFILLPIAEYVLLADAMPDWEFLGYILIAAGIPLFILGTVRRALDRSLSSNW